MSAAPKSRGRAESPAPPPKVEDKQKDKPKGGVPHKELSSIARIMHVIVAPLLSGPSLEMMAKHKYKAGAYTPLDTFLSPHLQTLCNCLPMWLAPNLITLGGAIPMTLLSVYLGFCCPTFEDRCPRWVMYSFGIANLFYLVCDAIDGKQARRTGSSSPLGQVFDHGIDCLMVILMHWVIFSVTGLNASLALPLQAGGQLLIFLGHWEEHFTHIFRASVGPVGVTEVTILMSSVALVGGLTDPDTLAYIQHYPLGVAGLSLNQGLASGWLVFVFGVALCYLGVGFDAAHKANLLGRAFSCLVPPFVIAIGAVVSNSANIAEPRLMSLVIGMLFFLYTTQMIVASMARQPYSIAQPTVLGFLALISLSWYMAVEAFGITLRVVSVVTVAGTYCWSSAGVLQLADYFDVGIFRIIPKKAQ